jgi:hypothetical protein
MDKLLLAIAVAAVLSTPALARTTAQTHKASVQSSHLAQRAAQRASDPYWKPCHFSRFGNSWNTCD